jgi:hypothetical protein
VAGIFTTRNQAVFSERTDNIKSRPNSAEDIGQAIGQLQSHFTELDRIGFDVGKRAGVRSKNLNVNFASSPWKSEDAK